MTPDAGGSTPTAANWATETVALRAVLPQSITIPAVSGYSPTDGNNDLLLVSITARGSRLGHDLPDRQRQVDTARHHDGGSGANQITQTVFWTTAPRRSYLFTFNSNSRTAGQQRGRGCERGRCQLHRRRRYVGARQGYAEWRKPVDHADRARRARRPTPTARS